jgi:glutaryl-CoA dehydrogenase
MLTRFIQKSGKSVRHFASLQKFDYLDPFRFTDLLTEEERMVEETAKQYAQEKLLPRVTKAYQEEKFDVNIMREMGELGFLGCTIGDYDLPGVSSVAYGLINRQIEHVDSGYRSALSVQSSLVMYPIHTFGSKAIKDKYIPKLATGEWIGCFGLTEPDAGSDPAGMKTKAKDLKNGYYSLSGTKTWITNSPHAHVMIVWAKLEGTNDIRGFVVERAFGGVETPIIKGKLSLRASDTGMIMLDDCRVPKENMLDVSGLKGPFSCLNQARHGIAWGTMGAAEFCLRQAVNYQLERKQFNKPLASMQL